MGFCENLQYLRNQSNMTQEVLAERIGVSRQTVSKWESGSAYPEMEKLLILCNLYGIDMDTLLRGNAEEKFAGDTQDYDAHMNRFTFLICAGVFLVLLGVTMLALLFSLGVHEALCVVCMFLFLIAAVSCFIIGGIGHGDYVKDNPRINFTYDREVVRAFRRTFPLLIVIPTAAILFGVILLVGLNAFTDLLPGAILEDLSLTLFLLMVTFSAPVYVYAGMQAEKYNTEGYNREHDLNRPDTPENRRKRKADAIGSGIVSCSVFIYLLLGFVWNLWHPGWVIIPIAGIISSIIHRFLGVEED